jgi:hypothetical protein
MKKLTKRPLFTVLIPVLALFAVSCPNPAAEEEPVNHYPDIPGDESFYAYDNGEPAGEGSNRNYYEVRVAKLWEGRYCEIWVDRTIWVSPGEAQNMANEFDLNIQPKITRVFDPNNIYNDFLTDYGPYLDNRGGKTILLLLDIKDTFGKNGNAAYVGGYFDLRDLAAAIIPGAYPYGNRAAMLYIDTYPNVVDSVQSYSTIAHEFQHLLNFINSLKYRVKNGTIYPQDTWINEGLSSAAEYIYQGGHDMSDQGRIDHFNTDPYRSISKGNNFFVWGENRPEGDAAILDEYATVYMFFQWLRLQSGGYDIYQAITTSEDWDYQAVTGAAEIKIDPTFSSWETLLGTWLQANYLNADGDSRFGYREDGPTIKPRVWALAGGTYYLYPGEAVYSLYNGAAPSDSGVITFASIPKGFSAANDPYPSGETKRLLMFNKSTDVYKEKNGYLVSDPVGTSGRLLGGNRDEEKPSSASNRSVRSGVPYVIDARDLRRQSGWVPFIDLQVLNVEE